MTSEGVNGKGFVESVPKVSPQATGGGRNKKSGHGLTDGRPDEGHQIFTATSVSVSSYHFPRSTPRSNPSSDISSGDGDSTATDHHVTKPLTNELTEQDEVIEENDRDSNLSIVFSSQSSLRGTLGNDTFVTQSLPATLNSLKQWIDIEPPSETSSTSFSTKLLRSSQGTPGKDTRGTFVTRSLPATLPSSSSSPSKLSRSDMFSSVNQLDPLNIGQEIQEKWLVKPEPAQDHPTHSNGGRRLGQYVLQSLQVRQFDLKSKYITGFSAPLRKRSTTTTLTNEFGSFVCLPIGVRTDFIKSGSSLIPSDGD